MRVLVVVAENILINSSANLCHLAYVRGLVDAGYEVHLLCASNRGTDDPSMQIPQGVTLVRYDGEAMYEKLSPVRKGSADASPVRSTAQAQDMAREHTSLLRNAVEKGKAVLRSVYGCYGFQKAFVRKALRYRNPVAFDLLLSLSSPPASHLLARRLLKWHRIRAKRWIQIWEDPWNSDLYTQASKRIAREERRLLSFAEKVCYVSPLTLNNQKKLYPSFAQKMFWQPLPSYYESDNMPASGTQKPVFGYFGDYYPFSRNLKPFYEAAVQTGCEACIVGNPSDLFEEAGNVHILPRMPLNQLKEYEAKANVLVFLCNLGGGQIPGKIYQYSATYKKIIFILDGNDEERNELRRYFEQFHRYIFCENTVESIANAMNSAALGTPKDIVNQPVSCFEPVKIVKRILEQ